MSVSASLDDSPVSLEPGSEAALPVQVLNSGTTVEEVTFEVVGPCAGWATVEPPSLSLYPGASGEATITLRPPRSSSVLPGEAPVGLRVVPTSDAAQAVVPERSVEILPFSDVTSEVVPRASHSAWRGRHEVAVDNRGNTHASFALEAREESERARLAFEPAQLDVPPGEAKFAKLKVRPTNRVWRGAPVTHPFQVLVTQLPLHEEAEPPTPPVVLDGTYEQEAILPRWLPRVLIAAVLLVGLLAGLWYGLLRPTVRSAAKEAVTPEVVDDAVEKAADEKAGGQDGGKSGAAGGPNGKSGGSSNGRSGGAGSAGASGGGGGGKPASARVQVKDAVGGGASARTAYTVPEGQIFSLTDIVVQNPQGDSGTVAVSSEDGQLLDLALENFRDSDYHFVTPIDISEGGKITISITCRQVGKPVKAPKPSQCSESLFLGGSLRDK